MKKLALVLIVFFCFSNITSAQKRYSTFEIKAPQLDTIKKIWVYLALE